MRCNRDAKKPNKPRRRGRQGRNDPSHTPAHIRRENFSPFVEACVIVSYIPEIFFFGGHSIPL
jgi:hypothetical protein